MEATDTVRATRGFALVMVSGLLALLMGTALAFSRIVGIGALGTESSAWEAALAAAGGMEYAAARLQERSDPVRPSQAGARADDWTFREPAETPLEKALNPSYAHGEAPWSGRLRGGSRFALKIECLDGKIPVNAGYLDVGTAPDNPMQGTPLTRDFDEVPDHGDVDVHPYHMGLATLLDGLGAVLDLQHRRKLGSSGRSQNPADWIQPSWLGQDLIARRPLGGYPDLDAVDAALLDLGYPAPERQRVLAHIDCGPYETPAESARTLPQDADDFPPYAPVSATAAAREVLAAHWTYLSAQRCRLPGGTYNVICTRTGTVLPEAMKYMQGEGLRFLIFKDEAEALADLLIDLREEGPLSWEGLARRLAERAPSLFSRDYDQLAAAHELPARFWTQAKAEMAFRAVSMDPYPWEVLDGSATWAGWGIDRDGSAANGVQPGYPLPDTLFSRVHYPDAPDDPWPASPAYDMAPYIYSPFLEPPLLRPCGFALAPPARFRVETFSSASASGGGATRRMRGLRRIYERLDFSSQEDFENLAGGARLARRGIGIALEIRADREWRHDWGPVMEPPGLSYPDGTVRIQPHVTTLPRWNRLGVMDAVGGLSSLGGYSRSYGAVCLSTLEGGLRDASLYWPFSEDFDEIQDAQSGGPHADFLSEKGMGWPFGPYAVDPAFLFNSDLFDQSTPRAVTNLEAAVRVPGLEGPPGGTAGPFSVECWLGPESYWSLRADYPNLGSTILGVNTSRIVGGLKVGTTVSFNLIKAPPYPANPSPPLKWTFLDGDGPGGRTSWNYHVVLTVEPEDDQTRFRCYVNGRDTDSEGKPLEQTWPFRLVTSQEHYLGLARADEVRLYGHVLEKSDAERRHALGRFVRQGTHRSPLYVLDRAGRLGEIQWTGLVPPGFPAACLTLEVQGFRDGAGTVPAGPPVACPTSGARHPLRSLGSVRSFRYAVRFDCREEPLGPLPSGTLLDDTPVFESVWITLLRPGRAPRWDLLEER